MNRRPTTTAFPVAGPSSMWFLATFTWTASVLLIGCARWSPPPLTETNQLPMPGLAKESVVLEVTFVRIPAANTEFADHFWREVDEGWVNNQLRRRMAANGLRCGLLGESVPANLQKVLDAQQAIDPLKMMTDGQFGSDVIARTHQIRSQAGQPGKIVVRSGPIESVAALEFDDQGHVHGETLEQSQFHISFRTNPQGSGQVILELTPAIEHGQPRSRYVGREGNWALDSGSRPVKTFGSLRLESAVAPGQTVALTCTAPARGLGAQFFAADPSSRGPRLMLLIRVQQTQMDDRFLKPQVVEPLATGMH